MLLFPAVIFWKPWRAHSPTVVFSHLQPQLSYTWNALVSSGDFLETVKGLTYSGVFPFTASTVVYVKRFCFQRWFSGNRKGLTYSCVFFSQPQLSYMWNALVSSGEFLETVEELTYSCGIGLLQPQLSYKWYTLVTSGVSAVSKNFIFFELSGNRRRAHLQLRIKGCLSHHSLHCRICGRP